MKKQYDLRNGHCSCDLCRRIKQITDRAQVQDPRQLIRLITVEDPELVLNQNNREIRRQEVREDNQEEVNNEQQEVRIDVHRENREEVIEIEEPNMAEEGEQIGLQAILNHMQQQQEEYHQQQ